MSDSDPETVPIWFMNRPIYKIIQLNRGNRRLWLFNQTRRNNCLCQCDSRKYQLWVPSHFLIQNWQCRVYPFYVNQCYVTNTKNPSSQILVIAPKPRTAPPFFWGGGGAAPFPLRPPGLYAHDPKTFMESSHKLRLHISTTITQY